MTTLSIPASQPIDFGHDSLVDIREQDLVKLLLKQRLNGRDYITGIYGIPTDVQIYSEVMPKGLGQISSDIDLLLVPPGRPDLAIAVQVKRVKVNGHAFATQCPNKLDGLHRLAKQANPLAKAGFSQVYCFVFVVVDSRENNAGAFCFDSLTPLLDQKIRTAISAQTQGLSQRIGLVHIELAQTLDDPPLGVGTFAGRCVRPAQLCEQPSEITAWVREQMPRE